MSRTGDTICSKSVYTSRIIKAGALLADTKTLLVNWDETHSVQENLSRTRRENIFGKASRSRVEDILTIFRQRYLISQPVTNALAFLVKEGFPGEALDRILYFHAAQADLLLHDIVTQVLTDFREQGKTDVTVDDIQSAIRQWIHEGKMISQWSEVTILRVAQEVLSTLRDFGVLEGASKKRLAPVYLPVEAFAYLAFYLQQRQPSGERLLHDPEWGLFFLSHHMVERFFMEAHQLHLLEYYAAGSIIRIAFPAASLEEYAHALAQRAD